MRSRPYSASADGQIDTFSSLRVPDYRTLWWAGLFSFMSVQMQFLLRGLLAWDLTEREGALGLTYLCFGISLLIATPLGGVATDRLSKRMVLIASQGVIMVAALAMGLVAVFDIAQFWMLLISAVAQGLAFGFFGPARIAIAAELVGREQLGNAIALSLLSMNGTRVFAPALAGVFAGVATIGIGGAYLIGAVFSLVSFVLLFRLPPSVPNESTKRNPFAEMVDGVRYVAARPPLRRLVLASFFTIMFGFNYVVFYTPMIEDVFALEEAYVGYISSASAIGAVSVSFTLAGRADSPLAKPVMALSGMVFGVGVAAFGFAPSFWSAFPIIMLVGASTTVFQTLSNTLALNMADEAHQGRVQSLLQLSFAGFGMAAAPLGLLAESIGLRQTVVIMGCTTLLVAALYAMIDGIGFRGRQSPVVETEVGLGAGSSGA